MTCDIKDVATGQAECTNPNGDLPDYKAFSDTCHQGEDTEEWEPNSLRRLTVTLKKPLPVSLEGLSRNILTHGGCGMCSAHQVAKAELAPLPRCAAPESDQIFSMLDQLAQHQPIFKRTGGTHAAGWFSSQAPVVFEDVGRHNCVDKLVGHFLLANQLPKLSTGVLVLSGRLGFELVFKAYRARIPWIISLGAPTSMSVEFAKQQGIGLIAFANRTRYNIY